MSKQLGSTFWTKLLGHDWLVSKIRSQLDSGKFDLAAGLTAKGTHCFPSSNTFLILSARLSLLTDNEAAASASLAALHSTMVKDSLDQFELAECYRQLRFYDQAADLFELVLKGDDDELRRAATQSLVSVCLRLNEPKRALHHAVQCVRLGGWHHQHALNSIAKRCERESLVSAIAELQQIESADHWINNHRFKMISQFSIAISDWELANANIELATKSAFQAHHPDLLWDDSQPPLKPSVLVIGAMKAGSSALFNCLLGHPEFVSPQYKELHFFDRRQFSSAKTPPEYYLRQFPKVALDQGNMITGEASPGYYAVNAAADVKAMLPDAKIIFIRRDPVARAISHLFHNRNTGVQEHSLDVLTKGFEPILKLCRMPLPEFRQALTEIELGTLPVNRFLLLGCYDLLLRDWKTQFDESQILVLEFDDFANQLRSTMNDVFSFLKIKPHPVKPPRDLNTGSYDSRSVELDLIRSKLSRFYQQVDVELAKSTGKGPTDRKTA